MPEVGSEPATAELKTRALAAQSAVGQTIGGERCDSRRGGRSRAGVHVVAPLRELEFFHGTFVMPYLFMVYYYYI